MGEKEEAARREGKERKGRKERTEGKREGGRKEEKDNLVIENIEMSYPYVSSIFNL